MASQNLGDFIDLPAEVRNIIWQHIPPQNNSGLKSNMSILRACHQLYNEIEPIIYDEEVLCFKISPIYQHRSWMSISNQRGATWALESFEDAVSQGYGRLPYHKLNGLKIEIEAPDASDPGQLICLWKKVRQLVGLLAIAGQLPPLSIHLHDSENGKWADGGRSQQSIHLLPILETSPDCDYEIILVPFCRLRNVPNAKIHFPYEVDVNDDEFVPRSVYETTMGLKEPFGAWEGSGSQDEDEWFWGDDDIQNNLDTDFCQLDRALDELPGPTARMMRLERFSSWYEDANFGESKYLDELERISRAGSCTDDNTVVDIKWRYRLMVAFNPLSAEMQRMRFEQKLFEESMTRDQLFKRFPAYPDVRGWSLKQWEDYYGACFDFKKFEKLDRESRESARKSLLEETQRMEAACGSSNGVENIGRNGAVTKITGEEVELKDRWDREEWYRYYPEGIPRLTESLFMFEIEMGHSWSEDSPTEPRERFRGWNDAENCWEVLLKEIVYDRAVVPPPQR